MHRGPLNRIFVGAVAPALPIEPLPTCSVFQLLIEMLPEKESLSGPLKVIFQRRARSMQRSITFRGAERYAGKCFVKHFRWKMFRKNSAVVCGLAERCATGKSTQRFFGCVKCLRSLRCVALRVAGKWLLLRCCLTLLETTEPV